MIVRFLPESKAEFDAAIAYYLAQAPNLDQSFAAAVQQGLDRLAERPLAWPIVSERFRRYRLTRFPYGLVYAALPDEIVIVAVMHLHRRPDYWLERVKCL